MHQYFHLIQYVTVSLWMSHFPHLFWKQTGAAPASLGGTDWNEKLVWR